MITIDKDTLEIIKTTFAILIPVVSLIVWLIRRVDFGGMERVKKLKTEYDESFDIMRNLIQTLQEERSIFLSQVSRYETENRELSDKLEELQDNFDKLKMEIGILRENDEARAKSILENALKIIVSLGYTRELGKLYVSCLEGKVPIEDFTSALKAEQNQEGLASFPVDFKKGNK